MVSTAKYPNTIFNRDIYEMVSARGIYGKSRKSLLANTNYTKYMTRKWLIGFLIAD